MLQFLLSRQQELISQNEGDSLDDTLIDWMVINCHLSCQAYEYSQSTQYRVDKHIIENKGTTITIAFTRDNFKF